MGPALPVDLWISSTFTFSVSFLHWDRAELLAKRSVGGGGKPMRIQCSRNFYALILWLTVAFKHAVECRRCRKHIDQPYFFTCHCYRTCDDIWRPFCHVFLRLPFVRSRLAYGRYAQLAYVSFP